MKKLLFATLTLLLFSSVSVVIDLFNYNPYESGRYVFVNFFASLFIASTCFFTLLIFFIRGWLTKQKQAQHFWPAFRQGILTSVGISALLLLKSLKILDWWVAGPLVIAVFLLELFFQTISRHKTNNKLP